MNKSEGINFDSLRIYMQTLHDCDDFQVNSNRISPEELQAQQKIELREEIVRRSLSN